MNQQHAERADTMTTNSTPDTVDALALVQALRDAGLEARWEQTGGGVGTVYVGPWAHAGDPDYPFSACLIGPGSYYAGTLTTYELSIGGDLGYDPTTLDQHVGGYFDGEHVDIATIVGDVQHTVAHRLRLWDADARIVRIETPEV